MRFRTIVFDLDDTLYPAASGLMATVSRRIETFIQKVTGLPTPALSILRQELLNEHGTTLAGLQQRYYVDPEAFLAYVLDIDPRLFLQPDAALDQMLSRLPQRKIIFTNGPDEHAERVLAALDVRQHFAHVLALRAFQLQPKPNARPYAVLAQHLGHAPQAALYVDDRADNLAPARAMGMTTVLLGPAGANDGVDYAIQNIGALESIVAGPLR